LQAIFFPKITQFSQGNNVLDAAASNINDLLWRGTWVFQVRGIGLFGKNRFCLHLETYRSQEIIHSKSYSMLTRKQ
jgi:hypothetical protein